MHAEEGSRNNIYQTVEEANALVSCMSLNRCPQYPKDMYFYRAESFYNLS